MSQFEHIDPVKFAAWVSTLDEDHPMQVACRVAAEVAEMRRERRRGLREASHAIAGAIDWTRQANQPSFDELEQLRYPWLYEAG